MFANRPNPPQALAGSAHPALRFSFFVGLLMLGAGCGAQPVPQPAQMFDLPGARDAGTEPQRSGLPASRPLSQLFPQEQRALCEWQIQTLGGAGRFQYCQEECSNGGCTEALKAEPWSLAQCLEFMGRTSGCTATVGDLEQCALHLAPDLCVSPGEACAAVNGC
ncbi:MAG: hypothetical protein IPJ65_22090 [Archangiaceae bacterium]|nr:hypothetical protein [Archangiaceae bacterium]